jgi:hypothetical protein
VYVAGHAFFVDLGTADWLSNKDQDRFHKDYGWDCLGMLAKRTLVPPHFLVSKSYDAARNFHYKPYEGTFTKVANGNLFSLVVEIRGVFTRRLTSDHQTVR